MNVSKRIIYMHMHQYRRHHGHKQDGLVSLTSIKNNTSCRVSEINGGREVMTRLSSMGIFPGVQIIVSNNSSHGPLVVHVFESRVMLSRGLAEKILVE